MTQPTINSCWNKKTEQLGKLINNFGRVQEDAMMQIIEQAADR